MRNVVILKEKIYTFENGQIRLWRSSQTDKKAEERHLSEISFKEGIKKRDTYFGFYQIRK